MPFGKDALGKVSSNQPFTKVEFFTPIYSSPVIANDTLYVTTMTHLFAVGR